MGSLDLECPQNHQPYAALVPVGFAGCMSSSNLQFLLSYSMLPPVAAYGNMRPLVYARCHAIQGSVNIVQSSSFLLP